MLGAAWDAGDELCILTVRALNLLMWQSLRNVADFVPLPMPAALSCSISCSLDRKEPCTRDFAFLCPKVTVLAAT